MVAVLEYSPRELGATVPVDPGIPADTYTYDYIVVGGKFLVLPISRPHAL